MAAADSSGLLLDWATSDDGNSRQPCELILAHLPALCQRQDIPEGTCNLTEQFSILEKQLIVLPSEGLGLVVSWRVCC
jgi:hypothetical protein